MAVPKKKTTRGKTNKRRIHLFLRPIKLITCPQCNRPKQPHTVCLSCGFYKGKEVIDVIEKLKPEDKKAKKREKKVESKKNKVQKPKGQAKGKKEKPQEFEYKRIERRTQGY